jgi:hypothetical protein
MTMLDRGSYNTDFRDDGFQDRWRGPRTNLHEYHVVNRQATTGGKMGRTCRICHDVHGAMQEHLLNKTLGPTEQPMDFVPRSSGGECTRSCHDVKKYQRE